MLRQSAQLLDNFLILIDPASGSASCYFLIVCLSFFLSAPLHHHLEAIGWPEPRVTMRLWIIGQICGAIGLVLALVGNKVG